MLDVCLTPAHLWKTGARMHRKPICCRVPFALLLCVVLCLFSASSKILRHWCSQSMEGHRSINVLPSTDATNGMQYRKPHLQLCQSVPMRTAGTHSSHLALMFTQGLFKAISFICRLLYMLEISLQFLFQGTVQLSLNCIRKSFEAFLNKSVCWVCKLLCWDFKKCRSRAESPNKWWEQHLCVSFYHCSQGRQTCIQTKEKISNLNWKKENK